MIITGSYNSFVDKSHAAEGEKVSSGMLKVKMAMSIIGVSSIHLLQSFIYAHKVEWGELYMQLTIHAAFLIGYIIMAVGNFFHEKMELEFDKLELEREKFEFEKEKWEHQNNIKHENNEIRLLNDSGHTAPHGRV